MEVWNSLVAGLPRWEWVGILVARLSVGLLFAMSGGGKLFVPARRAQMRDTMRSAGLPAPDVSAAILSTVEFTSGAALALGFMTPLCCLMLSGVMLGALATTILPGLRAESVVGWLGEFLYLPEVLYLVILFWLLLSGPGWVSLDRLILPAAG